MKKSFKILIIFTFCVNFSSYEIFSACCSCCGNQDNNKGNSGSKQDKDSEIEKLKAEHISILRNYSDKVKKTIDLIAPNGKNFKNFIEDKVIDCERAWNDCKKDAERIDDMKNFLNKEGNEELFIKEEIFGRFIPSLISSYINGIIKVCKIVDNLVETAELNKRKEIKSKEDLHEFVSDLSNYDIKIITNNCLCLEYGFKEFFIFNDLARSTIKKWNEVLKPIDNYGIWSYVVYDTSATTDINKIKQNYKASAEIKEGLDKYYLEIVFKEIKD